MEINIKYKFIRPAGLQCFKLTKKDMYSLQTQIGLKLKLLSLYFPYVNYSLQVAFYPSFQMIVNSPVLIFTLLFDEIHSKWMNRRRMKVYRFGMKFSRWEQ